MSHAARVSLWGLGQQHPKTAHFGSADQIMVLALRSTSWDPRKDVLASLNVIEECRMVYRVAADHGVAPGPEVVHCVWRHDFRLDSSRKESLEVHERQSKPYSGPGFQVKLLLSCCVQVF